MKELETVLKAVADKNRLRILALLGARKLCVRELAFVLGVTQPSVSRHLKKLKKAGFVESEQNGFWTDYSIARYPGRYAKEVLADLRGWFARTPAVKRDLSKLRRARRSALCACR